MKDMLEGVEETWVELLTLPLVIWGSFLEEVTFEWSVEGWRGSTVQAAFAW